MNSDCPICLNPIGKAYSILECGHKFCSACIFNSIAQNDEESRHLCPMCRIPICKEVEPSKNIKIHIEDLEEEIENNEIKIKKQNKIKDDVYDLMGDKENIIENKQKQLKKKNSTLNQIKNIISKEVFPKLLGMRDNSFYKWTTRTYSSYYTLHYIDYIYIGEIGYISSLLKKLFEFKSNKNYRWQNKRDWDYHFKEVKLNEYMERLNPRWSNKRNLMSKIYKIYNISQLII